MTEAAIMQMARKYAEEVEAMCWSPRLQITNDAYQHLIMEKAKHVCRVLISREMKGRFPIINPYEPNLRIPVIPVNIPNITTPIAPVAPPQP
jgi:hypothetical protein